MSFGFINSEGRLVSTAGNVSRKLVADVETCANYAQKVVQDETQFNISTTDDLSTITGKVTEGYSLVRTMNKTEFPNFDFPTNDDSDHMVEIKKFQDKNYSVIKDTVINTGEMYAGVYIGDKFEGWNKVLYEKDIEGKVDKIDGKGLSTNDLTDELKNTYDTAVSDVNTLKGAGEGSVTKTVVDEIAKVVANAPEDLDTLKEISDWIDSHEDSAAAMNTAIQSKVDKVTGKELSTNDFTDTYKGKLDNMYMKTYTSISQLGLSGTPTVNEIKNAMPNNSEIYLEVNYIASKTDLNGVSLDNASCRIVRIIEARAWAEAHNKANNKHYIMRLGKSGADNEFTEVWEQVAMNSDIESDYLPLTKAGTTIASNTDFNTLTTCGHYNCNMNSIASTCINIPINKAGLLIVTDVTGNFSSVTSTYSYRTQKYITYEGDEFIRHGSTSSDTSIIWNGWQECSPLSQDNPTAKEWIYFYGKTDYNLLQGGSSTNNSGIYETSFSLNSIDGERDGLLKFNIAINTRNKTRLMYYISSDNNGGVYVMQIVLGSSAGSSDYGSYNITRGVGWHAFFLPNRVIETKSVYVSFYIYVKSGNTAHVGINQVYLDNGNSEQLLANRQTDYSIMKYWYDYMQSSGETLFVKSTSSSDLMKCYGRYTNRAADSPALIFKCTNGATSPNMATSNYGTGYGCISATYTGVLQGSNTSSYGGLGAPRELITPMGNRVYFSYMGSWWVNNNFSVIVETSDATYTIEKAVFYINYDPTENYTNYQSNQFILAMADYLLFNGQSSVPNGAKYLKSNGGNLSGNLTFSEGNNYGIMSSVYYRNLISFTSESRVMYSSGSTTENGNADITVGNSSNNLLINASSYLYLNSRSKISTNSTVHMASDEKVKAFTDDIQTDENKLIKLFDVINPKSYNYKYLSTDKLNIGFSAQEVEESFKELDIDPEKYSILDIQYNHMLPRGNGEEDYKYYTKYMSISYTDLHNLAMLKIKDMEEKHTARLTAIENTLQQLLNSSNGGTN